MKNDNEFQRLFYEHLTQLPPYLPDELLHVIRDLRYLNSRDNNFRLETKLTDRKIIEELDLLNREEGEIILLRTPTVNFGYEPREGYEIGNNISRYPLQKDKETLRKDFADILDNSYKKAEENYHSLFR